VLFILHKERRGKGKKGKRRRGKRSWERMRIGRNEGEKTHGKILFEVGYNI